MEKQIRLLIVEDNSQTAEEIGRYMTQKSEIEVVGIAGNAQEGLEMIELLRPNAVVADLIMPDWDGFFLLEKLEKKGYSNPPKVIMLSAISSEALYVRAMSLGATYYMNKPFQLETLYERLLDFFDLREITYANTNAMIHSKSLDEQLSSIFLTIGIPAHIMGYQFLKEAIKCVINQPDLLNSITKGLYPKVAEQFDTTTSKVERAIRHAIEVSWSRGKIPTINQILGYPIFTGQEKPTNGEFVALLADRLSLQYAG